MSSSPTQLTLKRLRDEGWRAEPAEYWQPSFASRNALESAVAYGKRQGKPEHAALLQALAELEKFGPGKRQDLFGFVDVVAAGQGYLLGVQCSTHQNVSSRCRKIIEDCTEDATAWLRSRCRIEVWGWKKYDKPIDRKYWRPTIKRLKLLRGAIVVDRDPPPTVKSENPSLDLQPDLPF